MKLYAHQQEGVDLLGRKQRILLKWDCGTGKTITVLAHIAARPLPTLVVAPRTVMHSAWGNDAKHFPDLRIGFYHGGKRAALLADPPDVTITTHETFRRDAAKLAGHFDRLVIDESSKLKTFDSAVTKAAVQFARRVREVILLSGTPAPNGAHEYWGQMACIDPSILGASYWRMVGRYFVQHRKRVWANGRERDVLEKLTQTEAQRREFAERIAPYVHVRRKRDCLDLPPVTWQTIMVDLGPAEWQAYRSAENLLKVQLDDGIETLKAQSLLGKLRQITGGAMYAGGVPASIGSAKLDALAELLDSIGPDEPVVIWAEYTHEIDRIAALTGGRIIDGRTADAHAVVAAFQRGEIPRLVCHPQACGHGITLTRACYAVWYSMSFSAEFFEQAAARLDRAGQTRPVTNYILLANDTVDHAIFRAVQGKQNAAAAIMHALSTQNRERLTVSGNLG
jgi:SNF2 family DNA or RNA helicase